VNTKTLKRFGLLALLPLLWPSAAHAESDWSGWWLPKTYSLHAPAMDSLFVWIFWITTITFILVQVTLIVFCIKYRFNPNKKKAVFLHGNQRLEMYWTIAPAIILMLLSLFSIRVWNNYRYSSISDDPTRVKILVIGQQFKWNTIYPGPDGEFGRYLSFPKPTDTKWPDGKKHGGVDGPAFLPAEKSIKAINDYNEINPLGKDLEDPAGKDDVYEGALAREIVLPANRPIEVELSSKDVLHDFFLPNYRVKLDAVPGMRGKLFFQATTTSASLENRKEYTLDELTAKLNSAELKDLVIDIDQKDARAAFEVNKSTKLKAWKYVDDKKGTVVRAGSPVNQGAIDRLKKAGFTKVTLYQPYIWELVCEELCGSGHNTMRGQLRFVTNEEYDSFEYDKPLPGSSKATTKPAVALGSMQ